MHILRKLQGPCGILTYYFFLILFLILEVLTTYIVTHSPTTGNLFITGICAITVFGIHIITTHFNLIPLSEQCVSDTSI